MSNVNQKGFINIIFTILILLGILVGIYLVLHPTIFKSKAAIEGTRVEFVDSSGHTITETGTSSVNIKLTYVEPTLPPQPTITNDINSFPKPPNDTGVGIDWLSQDSNNELNFNPAIAPQVATLLKNMGITWVFMASGPAAYASGGPEFAKALKLNGLEPIIRLWIPGSPNELLGMYAKEYTQGGEDGPNSTDIKAIKDFLNNGVSYVDFWAYNEANQVGWGGTHSCNEIAPLLMDNWTKDAVVIQKIGGLPIFPEFYPFQHGQVGEGSWCPNVDVLTQSFQWLQSHNCQLSDGSTASCLNLFDAQKTNGHPAVLGVHTYSWDNSRANTSNGACSPRGSGSSDSRPPCLTKENGAFNFLYYDQVAKQFLGRSVPVLSTEGGPAPWSPNGRGKDNYADVIMNESKFQMQNTWPFFFNTAFWTATISPKSGGGQFDNDAWFGHGDFTTSPISDYATTVNNLMNMNKVTRQGQPYTPVPNVSLGFPTRFKIANSLPGLGSASEQLFDGNGKIMNWVLQPGTGRRVIYVQFKVGGNWLNPLVASIQVNTQSNPSPSPIEISPTPTTIPSPVSTVAPTQTSSPIVTIAPTNSPVPVPTSLPLIPIYRYWSQSDTDHFYTRTSGDIPGYSLDGVAFHAYAPPCLNGTIAVYRSYNSGIKDHFYSLTQNEGLSAGYKDEGIEFCVLSSQVSNSVPVYRLWNPNLTDHFYTIDSQEAETTSRQGWNIESSNYFYVFP